MTLEPPARPFADAEPNSGVTYTPRELVPAQLLDGGEIVILAIKPSLWSVIFSSIRWILAMMLLIVLSPWLDYALISLAQYTIVQFALTLLAVRLAIAVLQWASRLYVLTNRRIMRIKGVLNVNVFECPLGKIQNTYLTFDLHERFTRLGTIRFATAGTAGIEAVWGNVPNPLEVHEQVRRAIRNIKNGHGL